MLTNFADHSEKFSHDALNRYMAGERLEPTLTWENVKGEVVQNERVRRGAKKHYGLVRPIDLAGSSTRFMPQR